MIHDNSFSSKQVEHSSSKSIRRKDLDAMWMRKFEDIKRITAEKMKQVHKICVVIREFSYLLTPRI
jgi:hypothetical protein